MNDGGRFLARRLRRRHRGATVLLGLAVGLATGVVLLGAVSARRSSDAVQRFVETAARGVDASVMACPTPEGADADIYDPSVLGACFSYVPSGEVDLVEAVPGVDVLGMQTAVLAQIKSEGMAESNGSPYVFLPLPDGADPSAMLPPVVDGRLPAPGSSDEMVLDESTFRALGLELGAEATITPFTADQQFDVGQPGLVPAAEPSTVRIVGVTREPSTLVATSDAEGPGDNASLYAPPGWLDHYTGVAQWGTLIAVSSDLPFAELDRRIRAVLHGFDVEVEPSQMREPGVVRPATRAVELETWSTWVSTGLLAFAVMVFAGQALARQTSREWEDGPTFRALGLTRLGAARIGAARALPIALIGGVTAVVVAIAASPLTPVALARRADPDLGVVVDLPVLGIGAGILMVGVIAIVAVVARRRLVPVLIRPVRRSFWFARGSRRLADRPTAWTGLAFATDGRSVGRAARRAAVGGLAFAAVVAVVAAVIPASMDHLLSHPAEYGATHNAYIGGIGDTDSFPKNAARVASIDEVAAASGIMDPRAFLDGDPIAMLALAPIPGRPAVTPHILTGREPIRADEVAMGQVSMREHGLEVGDRVPIQIKTESIDGEAEVTIVGAVALHGETDTEPGRGILASWGAVRALDEDAVPSSIIVRFDPARRAAGLAALRGKFSDVELAHPQSDLRNLDRIVLVPALLAGVVFLLALAALVHALVLGTRRHRLELATLRAIGFTRGAADGSMIWMAVALAGMALVIGVPVGWIVGRTLWRTLMHQLGLASGASTYWLVWVVVPVVTLVVAALAAYLPARRATRTPPGETLRTA